MGVVIPRYTIERAAEILVANDAVIILDGNGRGIIVEFTCNGLGVPPTIYSGFKVKVFDNPEEYKKYIDSLKVPDDTILVYTTLDGRYVVAHP